jgi:phospholipid/cholesterol/gamma-HCH transport system substrate-binding protein
MKRFNERNPLAIGAVGIVMTALIGIGAVNYQKLPFLKQGREYSAYFAEAGGLQTGAAVQVSGFEVGKVADMKLENRSVLITFNINEDVRLGDRAEAAIATKSLLGAKILEVTPRGEGQLSGPIPVDRTVSPYQLPDALGDLTQTISGLDTAQVSEALATLSQTFSDTPPDLRLAVSGAARFAQTIDARDEQLRNLLANANKVTSVLSKRSGQVVSLVADTNALLAQLRTQSGALDQISGNISAISQQLSGFIADNRPQLQPALDHLNGVLTLLDNRKREIQDSVKQLNSYILSLGESASDGPFFKAYIANLPPGQWMQPFIDAAFSDLGLDPNVLAPSERTDPQVGQPGTPALPIPFPRTGQGGEPNLTLPDAITGKPGDPRYPYREPVPAPPPGGPPPGPPAKAAPGRESVPGPMPSGVYVTAPNEVPPPPNDGGQ